MLHNEARRATSGYQIPTIKTDEKNFNSTRFGEHVRKICTQLTDGIVNLNMVSSLARVVGTQPSPLKEMLKNVIWYSSGDMDDY